MNESVGQYYKERQDDLRRLIANLTSYKESGCDLQDVIDAQKDAFNAAKDARDIEFFDYRITEINMYKKMGYGLDDVIDALKDCLCEVEERLGNV